MANKRQSKDRPKNSEKPNKKGGTNAPDKKKRQKKPKPPYQYRGINRMVNQFVVDDEKQEKKDARKQSLSKYNIFAKTEPRKRQPANKNDSSDFWEKNSDSYGDEYYDRSAMRKMQKKGKRKKLFTTKMLRRRKIITCGLLLIAIVFTCVVLSLTVLFRTEGYTVEGTTRYSDSEIIETCGIAVGENIFIANKKAAEERLKVTFPYISDVKVRAGFPDKIKISITEGKQSYQVKYSKKQYCVVSAEGRILKICEKDEKLPTVKGVKLKDAVIGAYVEYSDSKAAKALEMIVTSVAKNSFNGLNEINIKNKANITLKYDGRITVKLGLPEDIDYKIRTAIAIINEKLDPNNTGAIAGDLDVSTCNTTKHSYFNEVILTEKTKPAATTPSGDENSFVDADNDGIPDETYTDTLVPDYGLYTDNSAVDYGMYSDGGTVDYSADTSTDIAPDYSGDIAAAVPDYSSDLSSDTTYDGVTDYGADTAADLYADPALGW